MSDEKEFSGDVSTSFPLCFSPPLSSSPTDLHHCAGDKLANLSPALDKVDNQTLRHIFKLHCALHKHLQHFNVPSSTVDSTETAENFLTLVQGLQSLLEAKKTSQRCDEICEILEDLLRSLDKASVRSLLWAYSQIKNGLFEPNLPEIPSEVDEDEGSDVKIVRLIKNDEPLGATIKLDEKTGNLLIARIMHGGVADRSGCISVGDRVIEVNGVNVCGKQPTDVVRLLNSSLNCVIFKLIPALYPVSMQIFDSPDSENVRRHLRALVDYTPSIDPSNPCPEASLTFRRGDILRVVNSSDVRWWQARLVDGPSSHRCKNTAGFVEKREDTVGLISCVQKHEADAGNTPKIHTNKTALGQLTTTPLYEEVGILAPTGGVPRVFVLIGAPGVGRDELKRRLLALSADRFGCAVPHTSRAPRPNETDGVEYLFASRLQMLHWASENRFVEYGEYKGNFYGTLLDSVEQIALEQRRQCILTPYPLTLKLLRSARLRPVIVFIKAPSLNVLKRTRQIDSTRLDATTLNLFSVDELEKMVKESRRLERHFCQFFDEVIVNDDLDAAFARLLEFIVSLDTKPRWVPMEWISGAS